MVLMANRYITPAALEYQRRVADSVSAVKAASSASREGKKMLDRLVKLVDQFRLKPTSWQRRWNITVRLQRSMPSTCATRSCRAWRHCAISAIRSS